MTNRPHSFGPMVGGTLWQEHASGQTAYIVSQGMKREGLGSHNPFKGTLPITSRTLARSYFLKIVPLPNSAILGTNHLTHGPLGGIPDPNYSTNSHASCLSLQGRNQKF
jgi:hypothetical protein